MAERPGMTRSTASQDVKLRRTEALRWSQRALRILSPSESLLIYIYEISRKIQIDSREIKGFFF